MSEQTENSATDSVNSIDLLACPFCGSEALMSKISNIYDDAYVVTCSGEKDGSCVAIAMDGFMEYEHEAAEAWNKRGC